MIEIRDVSHRYVSGDGVNVFQALADVSITIESGTFVSFLGPSGCGKTTLLRIVNGLIKPSDGEVWIGGRLVDGPAPDRAMVFQEFNLLPWRTARGNVEFPLEMQGVARAERGRVAERALAQVGLDRFARFLSAPALGRHEAARRAGARARRSARPICSWTSRSARSIRRSAR